MCYDFRPENFTETNYTSTMRYKLENQDQLASARDVIKAKKTEAAYTQVKKKDTYRASNFYKSIQSDPKFTSLSKNLTSNETTYKKEHNLDCKCGTLILSRG